VILGVLGFAMGSKAGMLREAAKSPPHTHIHDDDVNYSMAPASTEGEEYTVEDGVIGGGGRCGGDRGGLSLDSGDGGDLSLDSGDCSGLSVDNGRQLGITRPISDCDGDGGGLSLDSRDGGGLILDSGRQLTANQPIRGDDQGGYSKGGAGSVSGNVSVNGSGVGGSFVESMMWCLVGGVLSSMLQFAFVFGGNVVDLAEQVKRILDLWFAVLWCCGFGVRDQGLGGKG
jgi:hypothetical protein